MMLNKLLAIMALGLAVFGTSVIAKADLVPQDLFHSNDSLVTLDTATGLQWLNPSLTANVSYNVVFAGFGGYATTLGFRYATGTEVATLLSDAGIVQGDIWGYWNFGNPYYLASFKFVSLLGATHPFDGLTTCTIGMTAGLTGAYDCYNNHADSYAHAPWIGFSMSGSQSALDIGSFLVRSPNTSPVPEPSDLLLFGGGIGVLGAARRKLIGRWPK